MDPATARARYKSQTYIAGDASGLADVTDRVVIDLSWKLSDVRKSGWTWTFTPSIAGGR